MDKPFNVVKSCKPFGNNINFVYGVSSIVEVPKKKEISVASTDGHLAIIDSNLLAKPTLNFRPHNYSITSTCCIDSNSILTAGRDGFFKWLDIREKKPITHEVQLSKTTDGFADIFSIDLGGNARTLICVAVDNHLKFFDTRNVQTPVSTVQDIHNDIVNAVKFHPTAMSVLASGADDNTVVFHDTNNLSYISENLGLESRKKSKTESNSESDSSTERNKNSSQTEEAEFDDDRLYMGAVPNDSPPRLIKFIDNYKIAIVSTTEVLQTWFCPTLLETSADAGFCAKAVITANTQIRDKMMSQGSCGYIVDVIPDNKKFLYLGGSICGDLCLFDVSNKSTKVIKQFNNQNGHTGIIRTAVTFDECCDKIVTGGEDGYLYFWSL